MPKLLKYSVEYVKDGGSTLSPVSNVTLMASNPDDACMLVYKKVWDLDESKFIDSTVRVVRIRLADLVS